MNILIAGCGKVGFSIAKHLSEENNNVVVIDKKDDSFDKITESIDVMVMKGNALSPKVLQEAGVREADLIICVTNSDETNILCAITAKRFGAKSSIARVRDPEYAVELMSMRRDLGLDMIINPEQQAAFEISRLLRFPSAYDIETFVGGRVELISFRLPKGNMLDGKSVLEIFPKIKIPILLVTLERDGVVYIPHGDMRLNENDILRVAGRPSDITDFFHYIGIFTEKIKDVMIIGGGKITRYLADFMHKQNTKLTIIEIDEETCIKLSEDFRNCLIIQGDGTDEDILESEDISEMGAVVCLTDRDEENVIIGLIAKQNNVKTIVKINHINPNLVRKLDIGSVICPQNITTYQMIRYVRGLGNSAHSSSIQTLYKIFDDDRSLVEAMEFEISANSECINIPIKKLNIKKGVLLGCIVRGSNIIMPGGNTEIKEHDTIIVISKDEDIAEFDDILI